MEERLASIEKKLAKQLRINTILLVICGLLCACIAVTTIYIVYCMPTITETLHSVSEVSLDADELIDEAEGSLEEINKMLPSLQKASENITDISDSLTADGLPKLYESLDNLNSINFDTLNDSIQSLNDVVSPLATLFGR